MNWTRWADYLESDCKQYRIRNDGKPGGDRYCLYRYRADLDSFCEMMRMGTLDEMKKHEYPSRHEPGR